MPHQGEVVKTREGTVRVDPKTGRRTPVLMHKGQPYEPLPPRDVEPTVDEYENLFVTPEEFENLTPAEIKRIEEQTLAAEADQGIIDQDQAAEDQWEKSYRETRGLADAISSRTIPSPRDPETGERRMLTAEEAELAKYIRSLSPLDAAPSLNFAQISGLGQQNLGLLGEPPPPVDLRTRFDELQSDWAGSQPSQGPSYQDFLKLKEAEELGYAEGTGVKDSKFRLGFDSTVQTRQELEQAQRLEDLRQASMTGTVEETAQPQHDAEAITNAVASVTTDPQQSPQGRLAGLFELFQKPSFQRLVGTGLLAAFGSGRDVAEFTEAMDTRAEQAIEEGKLATEQMRARAEVSAKESQVRTNFITNMTKLEENNPGITQDERFNSMRERHGMVGVDFRQQWWVIDPDTYELVHGTFGEGNGAVASDLAILQQQAEMLKSTGKLKAREIVNQLEFLEIKMGIKVTDAEKKIIIAIQMGHRAAMTDKGYSAIVSKAGDVLVFNQNSGLYTVSPFRVNQMDPNTMNKKDMSASDAKTWAIINTGILELRELREFAKNDKYLGITIDWNPYLEKVRDNVADKIGRIRSGGAIQTVEMEGFVKQFALDWRNVLLGKQGEVLLSLQSIENELLAAGRVMQRGSSFKTADILARIRGEDEKDSKYKGAVKQYFDEETKSKNIIRRNLNR